MSRAPRLPFSLLALLFAAACGRCAPAPKAPSSAGADAAATAVHEPAARPESGPIAVTGVSPRAASNQTDAPLFVFGRSLQAAQKLHVGSPFNRDVPLQVVDQGFATARLPKDLAMPPEIAEVAVPLVPADEEGMLLGEGVNLVVVNDQGFPDLQALAATSDLLFAFVPSPTADEVLELDTTTGSVSAMRVGDGPSAIASTKIAGVEQIVVAHRFARELRVITARPDSKGQHTQRTLPAPDRVRSMDASGDVAYLLEQRAQTVVAIDLEVGKELWRSAPVPGAAEVTASQKEVAVSQGPQGASTFFDRKTGARSNPVVRLKAGAEPPATSAVLDDWRHRLYVAAPGEERVRVVDLSTPARAEAAFSLSSPWSMALSQDGQSMLVLERFAGRVARVDLRGDKPRLAKELPVLDPPAQADRRRGEILFFQGKQSCASCHPEGQGVRGAREVAAALASPIHLAAPQDSGSLRRLTAYVRGLTAQPSPWRDANGALLPQVALPDGRTGTPDLGRRVFLTSCAKPGEFADLAALFDRTRETPASKLLERCPDLDARSRADVEAFVSSL